MLQGVQVSCLVKETKTLADGGYVLKDLSPGEYTVTASLQGFKPSSRNVSLREGEEANQDFQLLQKSGTAKIFGHVYDTESGKVISQGGTIILILPSANKYRHIGNDGYYEFKDLPDGKHTISTSIRGCEDKTVTESVNDGESKKLDLFCRPAKIEEPPWG